MAVTTKTVWEDFRESLKGFISARVQNQDDAEDILQDVFFKIHTRIDTLKDEDRLPSWIYQITRNSIIDYYRGRKVTIELPETIRAADEKPSVTASTEIASYVKPLIEGLPEKYREAITLTDIKGMTQKELSENLGLSFSGTKSRVQRARGKLREELLECCHFEFDRRGAVISYQARNNSCTCATNDTERE
ncbi:MAG: RNA polymerase sigma factor SigZ [Deltaproteobacteria bacterium]|nr:RNA polymerase sigma factor SigZ [Deltaproteobacteria bacterium]